MSQNWFEFIEDLSRNTFNTKFDNISERIKQNINLLSASENDFVKFVNENIPPRPMNYDRIIFINKQLISCDEIEQNDIEVGPNACGIVK